MSLRANIGLLTLLVMAVAGPAAAQAPALRLGAPFEEHAVLQRDRPIAIWGDAAPGALVSVSLAGRAAQARADGAGRWRAQLPAMGAGGPYALEVRAGDGEDQSRSVGDVMVGDVWLCSGQSNMEMPVRRVLNSDEEISRSANPMIRLMKVPRASRDAPQARTEAPLAWKLAGPGTVNDFSAACFFMGRELERDQHVAMGLIDDTWGGTPIQAWISAEGLRALGGYEEGLRLTSLNARSPADARAAWGEALERWLATADQDARASQAWRLPQFDDGSWTQVRPVGPWEDWGRPDLRAFDGIVWMRGHVALTAAQAASAATLSIGPVDDIDSVWVNGRPIGSTQGWDTPRRYPIPAGVLKAGENLIAIRAIDTGGAGGPWGPAEGKVLTFADGSSAVLDRVWRYRTSTPLGRLGPGLPQAPWLEAGALTVLYNGMVEPLAGYGLKGVAWYQGESNVSEAAVYQRLLAGLFADWRRVFAAPDLPFLVVQLAGYGADNAQPQDSAWAALREAQRRAVAADPHAALAVAIDLGDRWDIHPANKQQIGLRLALGARRVAYGQAVLASGPTPVQATRLGGEVVVSFDTVGQGLVVHGAGRPISFELCGRDGRCRYADAIADKAAVRIASGGMADVAKVRYCWADSPICNLANSEGLPAPSFELDVR